MTEWKCLHFNKKCLSCGEKYFVKNGNVLCVKCDKNYKLCESCRDGGCFK